MGANTSAAIDVIEILIVLALILLNGLFALSELAIVSSRLSRLRALAASGRRGANRAISLASNPGRFLSTVQIGITLIGILSGVYSGEAFGGSLAARLSEAGVPDRVAVPLGYGLVVVIAS